MEERSELFLEWYAGGEDELKYSIKDMCNTLSTRLDVLAAWTLEFGVKTENESLVKNAEMYKRHSEWTGNYGK